MKTKIKKVDNENDIIKAAIYCRVSTEEQGETGLSLDNQYDRCKKLCESKEWDVYEHYREIASAKNLERPELKKCWMMRQIKNSIL